MACGLGNRCSIHLSYGRLLGRERDIKAVSREDRKRGRRSSGGRPGGRRVGRERSGAIAILRRADGILRLRVQPCRFTISLIQIGAKGEVQPLETG